MKKPDWPFLAAKKIRGRVRYFYRITWQDGTTRRERYIEIKADLDTPEFAAEYWAIRSGTSPQLERPAAKTTWRVLIREYKASPRYKKLAQGTVKEYNRWFDRIIEKNGDIDIRDMTRADVRAIHQSLSDTPRKADWFIQVVRMLFNFAKDHLDWKVDNPAEGIELFGKQREFEPWPEWMVAQLENAPEMVRTAAELMLGTGQRPAAAIAMRHDQFNGDLMTVADDKGGDAWTVYCPQPLRDYLGTIPKRGAFVLAKNLTEPVGYDAAEKAFRSWRNSLGPKAKPFVLHGLRKLAITRLAEGGATDAEIQAITGQSPEMVAYYRRRASRVVLSKAAHKRMERNKDRT